MAEVSKIAWTDSTCNFWSGCSKVSEGCKNCYALDLSERFPTFGQWGKGAPRRLHESAFKLAAELNRKPWVCDQCGCASDGKKSRCHACYAKDKFHRRRNFSLSLGDWLDPEVPVAWLARMLDTIRQCPDVDWLLCTKRPELWKSRIGALTNDDVLPENPKLACWLEAWRMGKPPENIVILTSVENQQAADLRITQLLRIPAWRRGLSCEPLLGPVDLCLSKSPAWENQIDWVIIGGESGNKARPCNIEWVRSLKDQCKAAGVPCFVKQIQIDGKLIKDIKAFPSDLQIQQFYV